MVALTGMATDVTDGPLTDKSLSWKSDRDGVLGTGNEVSTETLSAGWHKITLTAIDSAGKSGDRTIRLFVGQRTYLPMILK